ncbi:PecA family PE domain-processing aspartic protease [Mycolicibacterium aubagnense]|uniref:PecA family PE domain-processing aspartic protease n=1 Tax=Mycolicibacterium aubagnense TaxID=319707 RepID=UPI0010FEA939|nr:PecA family PE domain-processing aspartic protease [Mycolicibacterium aubagnense]
MAGKHRRPERRTLAVSTWLGSGVAVFGVSAALLGGAAVASAAPSADSDSSTHANASPTHKDSSSNKNTNSAAAGSDAKGSSTTGNADKKSADTDITASDTDTKPKTKSSGTAQSVTNKQKHQDTAAKDDAGSAKPAAAIKPVAASVPATSSPAGKAAPVAASTPAPTTSTPSTSSATSTSSSSPTAPATATAARTVTTAASESPTSSTTSTTTQATSLVASTPTKTTSVSGILSVFAAIGQALGAAAQGTEQTLAAAAVGTSQTLKGLLATPGTPTPATALTPAPTTIWQPGQTETTTQYVQTALQEISAAQAQLNADTWGKGNWWAGFAAAGTQFQLSIASWELSSYLNGNPGAMSFYQSNANGWLGGFALAALNWNEALPGYAVGALNAANSGTSDTAVKSLISQAAVNGRVYGSVPLTMYAGTEPIVYISVNGGQKVPVLVDTGSSGLVIGGNNVGSTGLGNAVGSGTGAYSGGLTYNYSEYNTPVDFGNGIVTAPTTVDIITDPTQQTAFNDFLSADGVVGVLGIGTNAVGPGPSLVTTALPGDLKNGIYIDERAGTLQFGPNPLPARVTTSGSPNVIGSVTVNGTNTPINLLIDSGGVTGTLPSTIAGSGLSDGTVISVYDSSGNLLYTYKTTSTNTPVATTDAYDASLMNTGAQPFQTNSIYIGYDTANGTTVFD